MKVPSGVFKVEDDVLPAFGFRFGAHVLPGLVRSEGPSRERSGHEEEDRIVVERLTDQLIEEMLRPATISRSILLNIGRRPPVLSANSEALSPYRVLDRSRSGADP